MPLLNVSVPLPLITNRLFVAGLLPLPPRVPLGEPPVIRNFSSDPDAKVIAPPALWTTSTPVADPSPAWMAAPLATVTVCGPMIVRDAVAPEVAVPVPRSVWPLARPMAFVRPVTFRVPPALMVISGAADDPSPCRATVPPLLMTTLPEPVAEPLGLASRSVPAFTVVGPE